jgi:septal ring factor EnvC (AmiA/AmiB activator)
MVLALFAIASTVQSVDLDDTNGNAANPIRKVVTMLQNMEKKVQAEAKKEQEIYDKFMCYCKNGGGELSGSISAADTKVPQLGSDIKEGEAKKKQLDEDLKQHQMDRSAAKSAMAEATSIRDKEHAAFSKEKSSLTANLDAMSKAIKAIESGMAGGFLQTNTAQVLKKIVLTNTNLLDADRQDIMAFLSGGQGGQYVPQSGQITGILKTIHDEMSKSLADAEAAEEAAVSSYDALMAAKTKEVAANTKAIEVKTVRVGELAVEIVQMKNDLTDTEEQLIEDKKFLVDLEKNCAAQTKEMEERTKTRSEELLALAETIKVLNDDDALELFKKTLPGASSSFVQVSVNKATARTRALSLLSSVKKYSQTSNRPSFDFITLAIQGKKIGFEKVIKMIDDMVATLKQEQLDDDHKKEYCAKQFDFSEDKKKSLQKAVSDLEISIDEAKDGVATIADEIKALEKGIKNLDKSVQEATEQRKEQHEEYTELMASDNAAKELLKFAQNRLNKFYNPKLYKAPPKAPEEAFEQEEGTGAAVLAEVHAHGKDAPEPPPEALPAYSKKTEESTGVIAMISLLVKDLDKEMTEAEVGEKDAQGDYEQMLSDSAEKRARDSKALTDKTSAKAGMESDLESDKESKASTTKELMATEAYISSLHGECDWLLQYFDVRKEARASEVDALNNAKAVLSGADFSLLQQKSRSLRKQS